MTYERTTPSTVEGAIYPPGAPVFSADGKKLGELKEVRRDFFKVHVSLRPDFWLSKKNVASLTYSGIYMEFMKERLGDFKCGEPVDDSALSPFRDSTHDALISDQEQLEQRERMENELAEQRRHLPHN